MNRPAAQKARYSVLFVDDEPEILKALTRVFRKSSYRILTAKSAAAAWDILKKEPVQVIVSDLRMTRHSGTDLLKKVKTAYPDIVRIILTGYADVNSVMDAVNQGAVYKFITKPWNEEELKLSIRLALVQYDLQNENRHLREIQEQHTRNIDKLSKFINKSQIGQMLLQKKKITADEHERAMKVQEDSGEILTTILVKLGYIAEKTLMDFIVAELGVKKLELSGMKISPALVSVISKEVCINNSLIPVKKSGNKLTVAMADPTDRMKKEALKFYTGMTIEPVLSSYKEISAKTAELYRPADKTTQIPDEMDPVELKDSIVIAIEKEEENLDIRKMFESDKTPAAPAIVNAIIIDALNQDASDIHIEPKVNYTMVRHRINGMLFDRVHIPLSQHNAVVSRIKVMAGLDISEKRRPQDGRISIKTSSRMVDARLSTLPTVIGEKVVFRILDRNAPIKDLDELGLSDQQIELVTQLIKKPQGCLLVTGPTGSGKTSTLYSLIQKTATIHKNYSTIEDPVEYFMEKAEQVMIKEKIGLTFPVVLKALLRQDPDTIMLGEIRDHETAEVAFHAALTGHTVLSTLHTNSCIATITRLMDMGMESHVISSALNGVIAQRLVRRVCPHCMVDEKPSPDMIRSLGMESGKPFVAKKGVGCDKCGQTGYMGRTGLYEVLNINKEISALLQNRTTEAELSKAASLNGMQTLFESGFKKIKMGITTCEEVLRVLGPQNLLKYECKSCGKMMTERFCFCPFCGKQSSQRCRECGRTLEDEWRVCPDCGKYI